MLNNYYDYKGNCNVLNSIIYFNKKQYPYLIKPLNILTDYWNYYYYSFVRSGLIVNKE